MLTWPELEARRFSHSRRYHARTTLERLLLYLRETQQVTDWRSVKKLSCATFAVYARHAIAPPKASHLSRNIAPVALDIRSFFPLAEQQRLPVAATRRVLAFPQKEQSLPHVLNELHHRQVDRNSRHNHHSGLRDRALMEHSTPPAFA